MLVYRWLDACYVCFGLGFCYTIDCPVPLSCPSSQVLFVPAIQYPSCHQNLPQLYAFIRPPAKTPGQPWHARQSIVSKISFALKLEVRNSGMDCIGSA
ncbi:uncharacterized protein EI90DRAFT_3070713 [Cantharellus anzutake]|uniref:uncharacterized protein n=1 Tax=Cantharellus anzutake TaxID=1750568 RepID=UPI0019058C8D|nr:uncharacterized protein EI90DRAFT_3070713 [Cantharellus anzutake]KAF8326377.1 hypothetical protein EI90DRAFT_3070713 [Cantharellus anzutake]